MSEGVEQQKKGKKEGRNETSKLRWFSIKTNERERKKQNYVDGQKNGHEIMWERKTEKENSPRRQGKEYLLLKEMYSMWKKNDKVR